MILTNDSAMDFLIHDITVTNPNAAVSLVINPTLDTGFFFTTDLGAIGLTHVTITNTGHSNILLAGKIDNPLGFTTIQNTDSAASPSVPNIFAKRDWADCNNRPARHSAQRTARSLRPKAHWGSSSLSRAFSNRQSTPASRGLLKRVLNPGLEPDDQPVRGATGTVNGSATDLFIGDGSVVSGKHDIVAADFFTYSPTSFPPPS